MEPHIVTADNAQKMWEWLQHRGGIAVWRSNNLSNPGASWSTPALGEDGQPYVQPTWQAAKDPERIITDPAEVVVSIDKEVKRFHIAVRMGSQGMQWKVTDAGTQRIRREVEKAGDGAFYMFDYGTQEAVIMAPAQQLPLTEYLKTQLAAGGTV